MPVSQSSSTPSVSKYDAYVAAQLSRVQRRIRVLDLLTAGVIILSLVLLYALVTVPLDRRLDLALGWRWLALFTLVLAAGSYFVVFLLVPMFRQLNPYFAARKMEQLIPDSKNSLVNWLDLKDQPLPGAIRDNVSVRAARDVGKAQIEEAVQGKNLFRLSGVAAALFVIAGVEAIIMGPGQFFNHLSRMLAPFGGVASAENTRLTLLEPDTGNTTITMDEERPLRFRVQVDGRVPERKDRDALKLLYRFRTDEPYQEQLLDRESQREWTTVLSASQLHAGGLWYRVTGGDARTEEYRIEVRPRPLVELVRATYRNRIYLKSLDHADLQPTSIEGVRGCRLILEAKANRNLSSAELVVDVPAARQTVAGRVDPGDPQRVTFDFVLEQDGKQHEQRGSGEITFVAKDHEVGHGQTKFDVVVLRDEPPTAELTSPPKDPELKLPANGVLTVAGRADDDHGVADIVLTLNARGGAVQKRISYRPDKDLKFHIDGSYPQHVDYMEVVELEDLKLKPGDRVECRLEVSDGCDYPEPLKGPMVRSEPRYVLIVAPEANKKKVENEKAEAKKQKQKHDKKEDDQRQQEEDQKSKDQKGSGSGSGPSGKGSDDKSSGDNQQGSGSKGSGSGSDNNKGSESTSGEPKSSEGSGSNGGGGSTGGSGSPQGSGSLKGSGSQAEGSSGDGSGSDGSGQGGTTGSAEGNNSNGGNGNSDATQTSQIRDDINNREKASSKPNTTGETGSGAKGPGEGEPQDLAAPKGNGERGQPEGNGKIGNKPTDTSAGGAKPAGDPNAGQPKGSGQQPPDQTPGQGRDAGTPERITGDTKDDFKEPPKDTSAGKGSGSGDGTQKAGGKDSGQPRPEPNGVSRGSGGGSGSEGENKGSGAPQEKTAKGKGDGPAPEAKGSGIKGDEKQQPGEAKPESPEDVRKALQFARDFSRPDESQQHEGAKGLEQLARDTKDAKLRDEIKKFLNENVPGQPWKGKFLGQGGNSGQIVDREDTQRKPDDPFRPPDRSEARAQAAGDLQLDVMKEQLKEILREPTLSEEDRKRFQRDLAQLSGIISRRQRARDSGELSDISSPNGTLGDTRTGSMADQPGSKSSAKQGTQGRLPNHPVFGGQNADDYLNELNKALREQREKK